MYETRVRFSGGQCLQSGHQLFAVLPDDHGTVVEERPGAQQGPAHLRGAYLGLADDVPGQSPCLAS
ncbi:hypothetical protein [Streptomyces sp. DASNCL29]|uniref:hypothetical protein n=1 Tax=Streptomyces sp. DASNCL29 TaxID=2583819 RepID=UPI00110F8075|nr:hypothetical protein [Streptomyces sp. DASNCL29]TMU97086.1 hypothetical protein FGK60_03770 [Streptomyces sp. DASNCL29]